MSEVKVFRIIGKIVKPNLKTTFRKEIRALSPENAKEKIYTDIGSKHRAKRFQIRILEVEEIPPEEIQNPLIRKLTLGEEPDVE
ncbi:MAG TPA: 50S ribosomal protein L18Ae [Candidatus Paceibacterota bacterium]|nr:50S ribosomal protein L18Ae [Candidatus Paceibacterota bacterium]